jgi:Flp pilus assembly protein TadD
MKYKSIVLITAILTLALPALAQHPDDIQAVREKLQQERQQAKTATIAPAEKAEKLLELGLWQEAEQTIATAKPTVQTTVAKAKLAIVNNEFEQAEKLVTQALKLQPTSPEALLLQSKLQVQAWELEKAKATANKILAKNPKHEAAALQIGRILMLQKKYDQALEKAKQVQRLNPKNADAYLLESDVHFWNQKPELAERPLITSLTLNPFNADARFNYGYAIWRRVDATQLNDMAAQWELALELNPLHYVTHWHWGNGHTNLTYADYAQPEDDKVRHTLQPAEKLIAQNKLQEALAYAAKVQKEYPQSVLPAMLRGSVYYMAFDMDRTQRLDSAQTIFQNILKRKKHYGPAHNALAAVIKQKQLPYLHNYDSLQQVIQQTTIKDPVNFARVFPDVTYYPGDEVQKMVWSQLYESIVYFPFLSRQNEKFVIPPLHIDLAIAMNSPFFRQATTFDNRQWMDIRGVGSGAAAIEYVVRGSYLERNVVLHEYVHQFHGRVFTDAENREVRRLYQNAMKENRTLDYYSANNEHEYLAQTYPAYFEPVKVHPLNHKSINTTADLKAKDPELYSFLDDLVKRQQAYLAGDKQAMASNWAEVYLNLSERALAGKNYEQATALLDTALTWDENYQPALVAYARVKQEQSRFNDAEKWLSKAEKINPDYAPVYAARAELLEAMRRNNKLETTDALKQQADLYRKALELEDDLMTRAANTMAFARLYASYSKVPEAMILAESYVKTAPTVSTYLRDRRDEALAYAHWLKGTADKAPESEAELARLVSLKPQNYELRQQYADVLAAQGNYKKAYTTLEEAQRILAASSTPRPAYTVRMAAYQLMLGQKDSAIVTAEPLLSGRVKLRSDNYKLVSLMAQLGDVEKATMLLRQQPRPDSPADMGERLTAVGILWESLDQAHKAEKSYKAALTENPYQLEARVLLAKLLRERGRNKQADKVMAGTRISEI